MTYTSIEQSCQFCGKLCKNTRSWLNHERCCSKNPNRNYKNGMLGKVSPKKGKTADTDESICRRASTLRKHLADGTVTPSFKGRKHSEATRQKWKQNPNMGGKREGSGRGKKGKYRGYYCDSTWELAWLIYTLDQGQSPIRNTKGFEYIWEGQIHKYFPDFILDNEYIEIKGQKGPQWEAKVQAWQGPQVLRIIDRSEIKPYLDYAEAKLGKDFWIVAYENSFKQTIFKPGA